MKLLFNLSPLVISGGLNVVAEVPAVEVGTHDGLTLMRHPVYIIRARGEVVSLPSTADIDTIKKYWEIVPSELNWNAVSIAEIGHCIGAARQDNARNMDAMRKVVEVLLTDGAKMQEILSKRAAATEWGDI